MWKALNDFITDTLLVGVVNLYNFLVSSLAVFLKMHITFDLTIPLLGIYFKDIIREDLKNMCKRMFTVALFII